MRDDATQQGRAGAGGSAPPARPSGSAFGAGEHPSDALLSRYLDQPEDIAAAERGVIEAHLAGCSDCRTALTDLRTLVDGLAALPQPALPRSFALTPELLGERAAPPIDIRATPAWARSQRLFDRLRWAAAVAAVLLALVVGGDLVNHDVGGSQPAAQTDLRTMSATSEPGEPTATAGAAAAGAEQQTFGAAVDSAATPASGAAVAPQESAGADASAEQSAETSAAVGATESPQLARQSAPADVVTRDNAGGDAWQLFEVGLALLLAWLLAALVALRRMTQHGDSAEQTSQSE